MNGAIYVTVICACAELSEVQSGKGWLCLLLLVLCCRVDQTLDVCRDLNDSKMKLTPNLGGALITMFSKFNMFDKAEKVLTPPPSAQDLYSHPALIGSRDFASRELPLTTTLRYLILLWMDPFMIRYLYTMP